MNRQKSYNNLERAFARSIVKTDGIKAGLSAKILLRVGKKHVATKVRITGKLKTVAQKRKDLIQENTVSELKRSRYNEIQILKDRFFDLSSRQKKKYGSLDNYIKEFATY